jgi:hypothetical protein
MFSKINYVDEVKSLAAVKLEFLQTCVAIGAFSVRFSLTYYQAPFPRDHYMYGLELVRVCKMLRLYKLL